MAACLARATRTTLKGLRVVPGRWLLSQTPAVCPCPCPCPCPCRPLHVSPAASLSSSGTEPRRSAGKDDRRPGKEEEEEEEEEEPEGPEYIPRKKAKNPMMKIGYAWMIGLPVGIISFVLAKREVDKNRLKQLKIRQRMKRSNDGEYEGSRYRRHTEDVKLDQ